MAIRMLIRMVVGVVAGMLHVRGGWGTGIQEKTLMDMRFDDVTWLLGVTTVMWMVLSGSEVWIVPIPIVRLQKEETGL